MVINNDIMHGFVDFDTDTWMVVEKFDRTWEIQRKGVSVTYYEQFNNMDEFAMFLRKQESGIKQ